MPDNADKLPSALDGMFDDAPSSPEDVKVVNTAMPKATKNDPLNTDSFHILGSGLNMQVNQLRQNYYNNGLLLRNDLSDAEEIDLLQRAKQDNYGDLKEEELKAAPWYVRAGVDAEGIGLSLGNAFAGGAAGGFIAAQASAPSALAASRIPVVGPYAAATLESLSYTGGFTTGSVTAFGTQAAGQMYGDLRLRGVSRQTAKNVAAAYGAFSAGLGMVGLGSAQKLGGSAMQVGLRNSLVPLAQQAGANTTSYAARKVQTQLLTRLGLAYAQNVAVGTSTGEAQILLNHAAKASAGYIEKHDFSTYTNWGEAASDMQSNFLQLLGASALMSTGVAAGGYGAGKAKVTTESILTSENVKLLENELKNMTPAQMAKRVQEAVADKPFPHEQNQGQIVEVTQDGQVLRVSEPTTNAPTDNQGGPVLSLGVTYNESNPLPPSGQADALANTPLGKAVGATPEDVQTVLDTLMAPQEDQFASPDVKGQPMHAMPDTQEPLTPVETNARINQIAADVRLLRIEQRKLQAQFDRKEKLGHSTEATQKKMDAVLNASEELKLERDMLEQGLLTREDVAGASGKQRMKAIADVMGRLQKSNEKLILQKQKYDQRVMDSRQTGMNVERRNIQTMQKQLKQFTNSLTKDREIRTQLHKMIAGVTTPEQFKSVGNDIRDRMIELEQKKIESADKDARQKLIDQIDTLVSRGAKVKMQSGRPVSNLDADTVASMQQLKAYIKDQMQPVKKQQNLAEQDIATFNDKRLNGSDAEPTYSELIANGQTHLIPTEELQKYQLAVLAADLKNKSALELNVAKGNIAQMIQDAKDLVKAKQEALAQKRATENQIAEEALGVSQHTPIEGNAPPLKNLQQQTEGAGAQILSWDGLLEYVAPHDTLGTLKELLDVTGAKRQYIMAKEVNKGALRQELQARLKAAGSSQDWLSYINDAATDEYEFRYPKTDGTTGTARYTRAQLMEVYGWFKNPELHATMRNSEKGNGWTLEGDVNPGESFQELVMSVLKPEDISIADGFMEFGTAYGRDRINPWYREKAGVDLPLVENYWPVTRETSKLEMGQKRNQMFASVMPKSAKSRVNSLKKLTPKNAFDTWDNHIDDWEHAIAYDDVFGTMQNVLKRNTKVRKFIADERGTGTLKVFDDYLDRFVDDMPMRPDSLFGAAIRGSLARAVLPWRAPIQIMQQMSSGFAMWKDHSLPEIAAGYGAMLKNPKNIIATEKAFRQSPILKHRFEGGVSYDLNVALNQAGILDSAIQWGTGISNVLTPEQQNALVRLGFEGIRRGDAASVRVFGSGVYWAELNKGATPEQAMKKVELLAETTQQGDSVDQMPYVYANHPVLYTLLGQFKLQPLQLFNHSALALRRYWHNPSPTGSMELAKNLAVLWLLPGLFYATVQNAPSWFLPQNAPEDPMKEIVAPIAMDGLMNNISGVPVLGAMLEATWFRAAKPLFGVDMSYRTKINNASVIERFNSVTDAWAAWDKVFKADDDTKLPSNSDLQKDPADDVFKATFKTGRALGAVSGFPVQAINAPAGVLNALRHDDWVGAAFAVGGWSPGSIQQRYQKEDNMVLPNLSKQEDAQSFVDLVNEGIIKQDQEDQNTPPPDENILDGILYGTVNSEQ